MKISSKKYMVIIIGLLALWLAVLASDKLTKRIPLSTKDAILEVNLVADRYEILFSGHVTGSDIYYYPNEGNKDKSDAIITAWTSPISKYLKESKTSVKFIEAANIMDVLYSDINDGGKNYLLNREYSNFDGGSALLAKLTLNYYNLIALGLLIVFGLVRLFMPKDTKFNFKLLTNLSLLLVSYLISGYLVLGFSGASHFLNRDITFILLLTIIQFSIMVFAKKLYSLNKQ